MRNATSTLSSLALAGLIGVVGCDLDVPDLNNPGIDQLVDDPDPASVAAGCTGMLIGYRGNIAAANGYVVQLGILGREAYNFDPADPRYVGELLAGALNPGSPFGGNFWAGPYANIQLGHIVLHAIDKVIEFDDTQRTAIRGYVHTMQALSLLEVISTRDSIGAVIDTDREIGDLGPVVSKDEVYQEIADLLDQGADELADGGASFPFTLGVGFEGFETPASFREFNRAIRARVAAYMEDYDTVLAALDESFIDDTADRVDALDAGVYLSYGTGVGDTTNGMTNPNIFVHPSVVADAQMNGDVADDRVGRKVFQVPEEDAGGAQGLTSDLKFTMYTHPNSPVPIIKNEELILLRAEAEWAQGDLDLAIADLDLIRTVSGRLEPLMAGLTADEVLDEILYNRRYSLLFEGGHRWIDLRRFDRLGELPLDQDGFVVNERYPLPSAECDARPGEPACDETSLGS